MHFADQFGVCIRGHGPHTVVFGNGFGTHPSAWDCVVASLVDLGYRVVTYDAAGASALTLPLYQAERHRTLFGFAEDLVELMQSLQMQGVSYVGHSVAGIVGVLAANANPELFASLTLLCGSACYIDDAATGYIGGFSAEQVDTLLAAMRSDYAVWANGFAPLVAANPDRPHLALEFTRSLLAMRSDIACAVLDTIFHSDHRADVSRVLVPTQVLQAAHDPAVPFAASKWLATQMRATDFRVIQAEGHFPHISAPDEVNAAIQEFLTEYVRS